MNLAARLEGLTKQYGVGIIVGEETRKAVPEVVYREIDRVRVKGKQMPVSIFEPIALSGSVEDATLQRIEQFHKVMALYQLYLTRIAQHCATPPDDDWDGVFEFQTK